MLRRDDIRQPNCLGHVLSHAYEAFRASFLGGFASREVSQLGCYLRLHRIDNRLRSCNENGTRFGVVFGL
jgi:hypothetical protein